METTDWLFFVGLGASAVGGLCLYWHKRTNQRLLLLQGVQEFDVDHSLYQYVKSAGGKLSYAAVRGCLSADDKVIFGSVNPGAMGVVRNIETKELYSSWDSTSRSWVDTGTIVSSVWKQVPFSLVSSNFNDFRINVKDVGSVYQPDLTRVGDEYKAAPSHSLYGRFSNYLAGQSFNGLQTVEKMLLTNSAYTILGEIKLSGDKLVIKAPSDSSLRYYITSGGIARIVNDEKLELFEGWKVVAHHCFAIATVALMSWLFVSFRKYLKNRKIRKEATENKSLEFDELDLDSSDETIYSSDDESELGESTCAICLTEQRDVVFDPCRHVCACSECAHQLYYCPICRCTIVARSRIFLS